MGASGAPDLTKALIGRAKNVLICIHSPVNRIRSVDRVQEDARITTIRAHRPQPPAGRVQLSLLVAPCDEFLVCSRAPV
jgi:hypothetical protein